MQPEIHLGPLTLQTFGICFALAFLAAGALIAKRLGELGKPVDWAYEIGFSALVGGLVGARLDFIVENYDEVKDDLLGNLFSGSGLVWYGGAIGGAIGGPALGLVPRLPRPGAARPAAPRRWRSATRSAGSAASSPATATTARPGTGPGRCPTPTAPCRPTDRSTRRRSTRRWRWALVAYVLWRLRDRFTGGRLFALYLVLAGTERFLVEFIRRNDDVALGLTQAQLISVAMVIAGAAWLACTAAPRRHRRPPRPAPRRR